jgi:NAD(P)-dependent dehydrogenase (short-subunit alcohol dehydrogenase family)
MSRPLDGRVALVAGATRGAGRGIARMLGEAGATVYCTGRSSRGLPHVPDRHAGRPETIEETAEMVAAAGGVGIPVRIDHTVDAEVAAVFAQVEREQERLDLLANVFTGQPATWKNFFDEMPGAGRAFVEGWIWPHLTTAWHAAKLMAKRRSGLIVELVEQEGLGYHGAFYFDQMETLLKRSIYGLAHDLATRGISAIAVGPGFMRTEAILDGFGVSEATWRDAIDDARAKAYGWAGSESPSFVGRAVAALVADGGVASKSGGIYTARELSAEYGFTDIDGRLPDWTALDDALRKAKEGWLKALDTPVSCEWQLARSR